MCLYELSFTEVTIQNLIILTYLASHFNFTFFHLLVQKVTKIITENLNKIIDVNHYPIETTRRSNLRHRPIGIGIQGLADTFILLGLPFESPEVFLSSD